jgi:hypothetical protein
MTLGMKRSCRAATFIFPYSFISIWRSLHATNRASLLKLYYLLLGACSGGGGFESRSHFEVDFKAVDTVQSIVIYQWV